MAHSIERIWNGDWIIIKITRINISIRNFAFLGLFYTLRLHRLVQATIQIKQINQTNTSISLQRGVFTIESFGPGLEYFKMLGISGFV